MAVDLALESDKGCLNGLYLRNLGSSLIGFMAIVAFNLFTPLEFFELRKAFFVEEGGWIVLVFFLPSSLFIAGLLQHRMQRPISEMLSRIHSGETVGEALQEKARRRLLNLPFLLAMLTLLMWVLIPIAIVTTIHYLWDVSIKTSLFIFFRAVMVGLVASTISFFHVEAYSREKLIPLFLPEGGLAAIPGTIKIPILRRIRVLYMSGTSVPMIILVGTLFFVIWNMGDTSSPAMEFGLEILVFTLVICATFVILALKLNLLVGRSILNPLEEMLGAVSKVKEGNFGHRMKVLTNDEIGVLCDAGNEMIGGLLEREKIRDTFGKYLTPEIRDQILSGTIPLDGERRSATVLFADLRDFTPYVEDNDPEEVIRSMREYFTAMQGAIRGNKGLILQYVGDEIEAVFGVPLACEDHADRAVMAALEMKKAAEKLNRSRVEAGKIPFRHGIGIHTGEVLVGNTGSEDQPSYALIGDTVNLASRIQGLTKDLQCDVLISDEIAKGLTGPFELKNETHRMVKGYPKSIIVYEVLG